MFPEADTKVNFVELEGDILRFWKEKHIFDRSVEIRKGGPHYAFYEGDEGLPCAAKGRLGHTWIAGRTGGRKLSCPE